MIMVEAGRHEDAFPIDMLMQLFIIILNNFRQQEMDKYLLKQTGPSSCSQATAPMLSPSPPKAVTDKSPRCPLTPHTGNNQLSSKQSRSPVTPSDSTPKSANSRSGWTVIGLKIGKSKCQLNILCKRSNGRGLGPYSSAPRASKSRPMWEPITNCEFKVENKGGGVSEKVFEFTNRDNETVIFRAHLMEPLLISVNPFTQKCAGLLVKNPKLLAMYISLLGSSEHFCNFIAEDHNTNGIRKDGAGPGNEDILQLGGSLSDYEEFVKAAIENADNIGGEDRKSLKISPASNKRKLTEFFNKSSKKMSITEKVENNYRELLSDEHGLEKSLAAAYVNFQPIPIEKLEVSPDMFLPINDTKVNDIAESMSERLDPAQLIVTVVPADLVRFENDGTNDRYWVVHGLHRLGAIKKLLEQNKMIGVPGFPQDRTILCYILKVDAPSLANYVNVKSNDLASEFQSRASRESLFFIYKGLLERTKDPTEALEVVEKICHSRHVGPQELTVYRKVSLWPSDVVDSLIVVIDKYQSYQTKDASARGVKTKIKRREPNAMTSAMFKQLGSCAAQFFAENHQRVVSNDISLKELLEESEEINRTAKDEQKVVLCATGVTDFESLKVKFPEKFNPEQIKEFSGAEVFGRKKNAQGHRLQKYVKSVQVGACFQDPVKVESYKHLSDISPSSIGDFDVIVLKVGKDNMEYIKCWIDTICCSLKDSYSVFVVLETQKDLADVYKCLDVWRDKPDFKILQCMFKKDKSVSNDNFNENVTFCVIFGKITVFRGDIPALNDTVSKDLKTVVSQVTPPTGRVACILGDKTVIQLHQSSQQNQSIEVEYSYFVSQRDLSKVKEMFFVQAPVPRPESRSEPVSILSADNLYAGDDKEESSKSFDGDEEEDSMEDTDVSGDDGEDVESEMNSDTCKTDLSKQSSTSRTKYC